MATNEYAAYAAIDTPNPLKGMGFLVQRPNLPPKFPSVKEVVFPEQTTVLMADGTIKAVADIKAGDFISVVKTIHNVSSNPNSRPNNLSTQGNQSTAYADSSTATYMDNSTTGPVEYGINPHTNHVPIDQFDNVPISQFANDDDGIVMPDGWHKLQPSSTDIAVLRELELYRSRESALAMRETVAKENLAKMNVLAAELMADALNLAHFLKMYGEIESGVKDLLKKISEDSKQVGQDFIADNNDSVLA